MAGIADLARVAVKLGLGYAGVRTGSRLIRGALDDFASPSRTVAVDDKSTRSHKMTMTKHETSSIEQRVKYIVKMAKKGRDDPEFRRIVASILTRSCGRRADGRTIYCTPEKNWEAEIITIFHAVRNRIRYTRDIDGVDTYQSPMRTWELRVADCDDASSLLAAILISAGYSVRFRIIRTKGASDWDHIFVIVEVPRGDSEIVLPVERESAMPKGGLPLPAMADRTRWSRVPASAQQAAKRALALDASVDKPAGWHPPRSMIAGVRDFPV